MLVLLIINIMIIGVPIGLGLHVQTNYAPLLGNHDSEGITDSVSVTVIHPSTPATISVSLNDSFSQSDPIARQARLSRKNTEVPLSVNEQLMKSAGKPLIDMLTLTDNLLSKIVGSENWVFAVIVICLGAVFAGIAGVTVALRRTPPNPPKPPKNVPRASVTTP